MANFCQKSKKMKMSKLTKYDILWSKMTISGIIYTKISKSPGKSREVRRSPEGILTNTGYYRFIFIHNHYQIVYIYFVVIQCRLIDRFFLNRKEIFNIISRISYLIHHVSSHFTQKKILLLNIGSGSRV
jgi:hypothetical protein